MRVSNRGLPSLLSLAILGGMPTLALAQKVPVPAPVPDPAQDQGEGDQTDIVVTGQRQQGAVIGDIPPEQQLSQADIRSYGVGSVAELLTELAPQTTSGRGGQPVVLLNGRRISSFAEIRDLPTEAIQRVDILPEEVALKYGYRADQKVVNFVLRRRFRAATVELSDRQATEGGRNTPNAELDLLKIAQDKRTNAHIEYTRSSALTENERDITPIASASLDPVDQRPYRTLLGSSRGFTLNASHARNILGNVGATINASVAANDGTGLNGLPGITLNVPASNPFATGGTANVVMRTLGLDPLAQRNTSLTTHLGTTLNGDIGRWRWSLTGNYDRVRSKTYTDVTDATGFQARINANDPTANPRAGLNPGDFVSTNRASSTSNVAGADALFNGDLFSLPAGKVSTSIRVGASTSDFTSDSTRLGVTQPGNVARGIVNGQANIDVPISSRGKDVLPFLGQLSANFNIAADHLSDFGTLTTIGYGANWAPIDPVRFTLAVTDQDEAPIPQQLGNPRIETANVRVFDYIAGTTATVTQVTGGNRNLVADNKHVMRLGLTIKPWSKKDISFNSSYVTTRTDNPIAAFPTPTAAIEAAFPQRFLRDGMGNLLQIDARPINYAQSSSSELRSGVNFSAPLKSKIQKELEAFRAGTGPNPFAGLNFPGRRPGGDGVPPGQAGGGGGPGAGGGDGRPGGFGGRGGGGGRFGGGGQGGGRLNFAVYHTWHFTDRVTVANGGPRLDLLNGDAIGGSGGQSRHEVEVQAGYSNNGLGARLSGNWQSGTTVNGGTAAAPEVLNFGGLATANLRLFADLGQRLELVKKHPWLRGARVSFGVDNILDRRQRVTDASGVTPISFQPDYLNPLGRTVRLTFRKLFF